MAGNKQLHIDQIANGDDATIINGNNNIADSHDTTYIHNDFNSRGKILTKSFMYKLLQIMMDATSSENLDYPFKMPAPLNEKLVYNNAPRYKNKIVNHADDYSRLDEVIKEFPNSEIIIQSMHDMFVEVADIDDHGAFCVGNGDAQLKLIETRIYNLIINDANFDADNVPEETIGQFCIAMLAVSVSKCRVLLNPGDNYASA